MDAGSRLVTFTDKVGFTVVQGSTFKQLADFVDGLFLRGRKHVGDVGAQTNRRVEATPGMPRLWVLPEAELTGGG